MYRGKIVEFGQARAILAAPQHPYTQLLLDSIPSTKRKWERTGSVASDIETKEYQLSGCKFINRCPLAQERCKERRRPSAKATDAMSTANLPEPFTLVPHAPAWEPIVGRSASRARSARDAFHAGAWNEIGD
ncbi:MAG: hypothetical protein KDE58_30060 [Caldilineaceae bacterium]|nr:hypothetical protein [Caldilineaceae bacterium]